MDKKKSKKGSNEFGSDAFMAPLVHFFVQSAKCNYTEYNLIKIQVNPRSSISSLKL